MSVYDLFVLSNTRFSAHVRMLAFGNKIAFSVFHVRGIPIFQNHLHIQNMERSPCAYMSIEISKLSTQHHESLSNPLLLQES